MNKQELIQHLETSKILHQLSIKNALKKIAREFFVGPDNQNYAYFDEALLIGCGQTISQPTTVVFMLELLKAQKGQKILEIGYGSGWQTALLSELVDVKGQVFAFEIVSELAKFGKKNLRRFNFQNLRLFNEDYQQRISQLGQFDRIISGAAFTEIPKQLKQALKINGRLVLPTYKQDIRLIIRKQKNQFVEKIYPGFVFVPITH